MMTRRQFATGAGALAASALASRPNAARAAGRFDQAAGELARIERESGGRLGVAVLDVRTGETAGHRQEERFPLCSTFKLLAAAAVLARVDAGKESLDRRVRFTEADLVTYSPITGTRVGGDGMSLAELCEAAITLSDNTAGNLLLASLGGPAGLTAFARSLGDAVTRLDRIETVLNEATPGDLRDTTTPAAMRANLRALILGDALSGASRDRLTGWLVGNKTGDERLRAGLPRGWRVGDKTGSGEHGTANDVAVAWPPGGAPLIVCAYLTEASVDGAGRSAALAAVGRAVAAAYGG